MHVAKEPSNCQAFSEWHEWLNEGQMNVKDTERSSGKYTDQMKMINCCMECCLFRQGQQSAMLIIKEYRKK